MSIVEVYKDANRQSARHFDKVLVSRLILTCFMVIFSLMWLSSTLPENQWMRSIMSRAVDMVSNVVLTLVGALVTLLTGGSIATQRATDKPPTNGGGKDAATVSGSGTPTRTGD